MMSIRIMQAVWEDKETSGSERLVLVIVEKQP